MDKKLYITTAIPYVNGTPHIGNALDYLLADIWARYQKLSGYNVRFSVGTDEHGNKIAAKAREANLKPQVFADNMYPNFGTLMTKVGAEYTDFIRTTDSHHVAAVQYIWKKLQPFIYRGTYEGWYCVGHEAFFTEKEVAVTDGTCVDHQTPYQRLSEENYFFKLSTFGPKIKEAIQSGTMQIIPAFRQNEILNLIDSGLHDISVSRPKKNLSWGVPVPDDPNQVIYVWIDALPNYLTVIGYPDKEGWQLYWPADVQVIGKDILRFHAAIWPAMLMALGLQLPKKILAHGFINVGGAKISKTVGNVIDPNEIIDGYGVDAFRYFFSRHIPTLDDGDFTWEKFETTYNNELSNELGNLISRVAAMVNKYLAGVIGDLQKPEHDTEAYRQAMDDLEFNRAMDEVWNMVRSLNVYIEDVKPWRIASQLDTDPEAKGHLEEVLSYTTGSLLQVSDLLKPFLPETAKKIDSIFSKGALNQTDSYVLFPKIHKYTPDPRQKTVQSTQSEVPPPQAPNT